MTENMWSYSDEMNAGSTLNIRFIASLNSDAPPNKAHLFVQDMPFDKPQVMPQDKLLKSR